MMENGIGEKDTVSTLFDQFCHSSTCRTIISSFQQLCDHVGLKHADHRNFYRKLRARINTWKAHALWVKLDKRASQKEYRRGEACANTRVIIIGGGVCGLRVAIETALLGARTVVVEKRDRFSRNNVLHLWPYLITDLKNLGAKKFFGRFCAGSIDHISIRQLQCILLKVALIVGVEIHLNVGFEDIIEPISTGSGWRIQVTPEDHPVSEYEFDVLIGADGKRNTLDGFKRKEFRGKLAIAITANFINRNTQAEARVEEISGVAFIFNQKFFKDLYAATNIDLENIVYYKDETHYFVMTAKKQSLLLKGVLKQDFNDTAMLLARDNVNQEELANYAREAADFSTNHMLPHLEFAVNHYGQADLAMFDFTSLFQSENATRVLERKGKKLLMMLVGDSLLEPFWPTGSGCARGFLGAFDSAWMIKNWSSGKMTTLQAVAERESIYQILSQTTPDNLQKNFNQYSIDPSTRYTTFKSKWLKPKQVMHLYDTGEGTLRDDIIELPIKAKDDVIDTYSLLRWCQKILNTGKYHTINITDLSMSWRSGLAFCALVHYFKPEAIEYDSLNEEDVAQNNQLAFDKAQQEFSINPMMKGEEMAGSERPDKLTIVSYLSQFYDLFKKQRPPSEDFLNSSFDESRKHRSPSHRLSILQKIRSSRVSLSKLKKSIKKDKDSVDFDDHHHHRHQRPTDVHIPTVNTNNNNNISKPDPNFVATGRKFEPYNGNVELTRYSKLPMTEIASKLTEPQSKQEKNFKRQEDMMPVVKVSKMAEILVSKFKSNQDQPLPEPLTRRVKGQPMMVAAQPASEFCFFCKKRVYIMERMCVEGVFFHSQCFKCDFCGVGLRANTYTVDKTSYGDAYRFFCFRHAMPTSRFGRPPKKRTVEDSPDKASVENIPVDMGPTPTKMAAPSNSPKKTPPMLSPITNTDDLTCSLKTPERIEFENTMEGLPEETEEEQYEHNLSASMTRDGELIEEEMVDEDEDSDDSDLEELLSEMDPNEYEEMAHILTVWSEDEEFQEAVDLYNSGRLEESICLAKETLRRSTENLVEEGYQRLDNEDPDDDTEVEDTDEFETDDSDTELEEESTETTSKKTDPKSAANEDKPTPSPNMSVSSQNSQPSRLERRAAVRNPQVQAQASKARADFFTSPAEPVRLDPFKMFGMERKSGAPVKEEEASSPKPTANGDTKITSSGVTEMESDEATDSQVNSGVLDNRAQRSESTDDDLDEAFVSAEYELADEEVMEKTAVTEAMEQLLADMDHRSESLSDSCEILKALTDDDLGDDDVFDAYRRQLSSKSSVGSRSGSEVGGDTWKSYKSHSTSDIDKDSRSSNRSSSESKKLGVSRNRNKKVSRKPRHDRVLSDSARDSETTGELGDTERSVLRSVQQMSDNPGSTTGSGQTTMEVLRSVNEINTDTADDRVEKCIQYLDDRFVTRSRGHHQKQSQKSKRSVHRSSSSESFTISTPSQSSRHTSSSSLSDEFENNKNLVTDNVSDDERPDSDMLRDYQLTLSHALGEDSDDMSPKNNSAEGEDLDETINADEVSAASPRSEYMSPRSDLGDTSDKFVSPRSDRNSSVYETPETSLTEQEAKEVQKLFTEEKTSVTDKSVGTKTVRKLSQSKSDSANLDSAQTGNKKKKSNSKAPKVIKQASLDSKDEIEMVARSSGTIIRPYRHGSREGSVESNPLERDAWGSSSSCNSQTSVENAQKNWRPLPPVPAQCQPSPREAATPMPIESASSPQKSKTVKQGTGRKLPDPASVVSKSPIVFQSKFMKKAYVSGDTSDDSNAEVSKKTVEPTQPSVSSQPVVVSQPRPLPAPPIETKDSTPASNVSKSMNKSGEKTKITVDFTKIVSDRDSGSDNDKKKKRIPVASALKKSLQPSLSTESGKSVDEDDIPFADDSDEEVVEKFYTPFTSVKPKVKVHRSEDANKDIRKRILPTPPKSEGRVLSPDHIRDIKNAERDKAREEARERARLKSDEELGLVGMDYTPAKARVRSVPSTENSCESSQSNPTSAAERVSDSDDVRTLKKIAVTFTPDIPQEGIEPKSAKAKKKKKSKDRDSSQSVSEDAEVDTTKKEKKKRSLIASLLGVKTPDKSKGMKERDRSSSNDTLEDKPVKKKKTKLSKSEKKKDKKKRKSASVGNAESVLSENMKDLKIGAVFIEKSGQRPGLRGRIVPPKASVDDFTDSEEEFSSMGTSMTSLHDGQSRRIKSDHGPLSEEELNARITRKIQHAARKQQKQQEQKRLRQAQEIQRKLQEVDVKQRELEERGVVVERALRGEGPEAGKPEPDLMQDWFNLVHEKNALVRLESELMVSARELELEDRQGRLQQQLRESLSLDDSLKSPLQRDREQKIYNELIEVVEERDKLVAMLEEERVREREEDKDLENVMRAKGFSLSPTSGSKILRNTRPVKAS